MSEAEIKALGVYKKDAELLELIEVFSTGPDKIDELDVPIGITDEP